MTEKTERHQDSVARRELIQTCGASVLLGAIGMMPTGGALARASGVGSLAADQLKAELGLRYRYYETAFDNKSASDYVDNFYTDDVVAVSAGDGYAHGKQAMLVLVKALMQDMKRIRVTWHEPRLLAPHVAFDLVQNEVLLEGPAGTIEQYKSMLIWKKVNGVWKVAADMYTTGRYSI